METLLTHRDASGGLFIGASVFSFALMNLAPAELLHLLVDAALQPYLAHGAGRLPPCQRPRPKKTPATKPALESCFRTGAPNFEEKAAVLDKVELSGANR
jgi:hypothetical protein